jgi:hypothetical protein
MIYISVFYDYLMYIDLSKMDWINNIPIIIEDRVVENKNVIYNWIYNDFDYFF